MADPVTFEGLTEPTQWLRLAENWAGEGRYEDALRAHEFYHRHALEAESSPYGVRLSFALAAWARLGALHEPALKALRATRRAAATAALEARDVERFAVSGHPSPLVVARSWPDMRKEQPHGCSSLSRNGL